MIATEFEIDSLCPECEDAVTHSHSGKITCPHCKTRLRVRHDGAEYILERAKRHDER